jgi:hypothetical protein
MMRRRILKVGTIATPTEGQSLLVYISQVERYLPMLRNSDTLGTGLANITFAWMVEQCRPYLAFDQYTNVTLSNYLQRMIEDVAEQSLRQKEAPSTSIIGKTVATITEDLSATTKWLGSFFSSPEEKATPKEKMVRTYCFSPSVVPPYKPDNWTLFRAQDSYGLMYQAISSPQARTPGACDDRSTEAHKPLIELGETHEWMHPSVKWRVDMSKAHEKKEFQYKSEPLAALNYEQKDGVFGWKHKEKKDVWIPEWPIEAALRDEDPSTTDENAEMALIDACEDKNDVRKFLREHAIAYNKAKPAAK